MTTTPEIATKVQRVREIEQSILLEQNLRNDKIFAVLFLAQWLAAMLVAVIWSPTGWEGKLHTTHLHVYTALFFGAALTIPPILMVRFWPGRPMTRHGIAIAQMMWSVLFIHLSGGRIETHFHIFGSLAFIAFYRDWKVLLTATCVVVADHVVRGLMWPESIYGIANPEWWRMIEHGGWVVFEDVFLVIASNDVLRGIRGVAEKQARLELVNDFVEAAVAERTEDLSQSREQYRLLAETTKTIPWAFDVSRKHFQYVGPQLERLLQLPALSCLESGFLERSLHPEDLERVMALVTSSSGEAFEVEFRLRRQDGRWYWLRMIASEIDAASSGNTASLPAASRMLRGVMLDVNEARDLELQLRQAQKLESVGRLASGIAHEINTPVQFVTDSVHFVKDAVADFAGLIDKYAIVNRSVLDGAPSEAAAAIALKAEEDADLPYLIEHVPRALERSLDGLGRVATIVRSMKSFAHPDQAEIAAADLNEAVLSTLTIARNEYKYVAEVETVFAPLPPVYCTIGDLNQAVLNIVVNAAHAIQDVIKGSEGRGKITVATRPDGDHVVIEITDTGGGIPPAVQNQIYDPFFTTKEVGKGTGQGLAIARNVVVEKHGGTLTFETQAGVGTKFIVRIPVDASHIAAAKAA